MGHGLEDRVALVAGGSRGIGAGASINIDGGAAA